VLVPKFLSAESFQQKKEFLPELISWAISSLPHERQSVEKFILDRLNKIEKNIFSNTKIISLLGAPGAGKSTLIEAITLELIQKDKTVVVLTVDPSSKISGGSLQGDRIRMQKISGHPQVYIRALPSQGILGGIAPHTYEALVMSLSARPDYILFECVGGGQSEISIRNLSHLVLQIVTPGRGDEVQWAKQGLNEISDLMVVNKSDLIQTGDALFKIPLHWISVSATQDKTKNNIEALVQAIDQKLSLLPKLRSGDFIWEEMRIDLEVNLKQHPVLKNLIEKNLAQSIHPLEAVYQNILKRSWPETYFQKTRVAILNDPQNISLNTGLMSFIQKGVDFHLIQNTLEDKSILKQLIDQDVQFLFLEKAGALSSKADELDKKVLVPGKFMFILDKAVQQNRRLTKWALLLIKQFTEAADLNFRKKLLPQVITLLETDKIFALPMLKNISDVQKSLRIGITGEPGAGKSTLINQLGRFYARQNKSVAVLAIDPSSPVHQGSILGDTIRMKDLLGFENVLVRGLPSQGELGGSAPAIREIIQACEWAGYELIIIESVGVGQSETALNHLSDFFVHVTPPGGGDHIQLMKSGLNEYIDMVVISKSDRNREAAAELSYQYQMAYAGSSPNVKNVAVWSPPIVVNSYQDETGLKQITGHIQKFREVAGAYIDQKRVQQITDWAWEELSRALLKTEYYPPAIIEKIKNLQQQIEQNQILPGTAAKLFWKEYFNYLNLR